MIGDGFIGIREKKEDPSNIDTIIPATRSASMYYAPWKKKIKIYIMK